MCSAAYTTQRCTLLGYATRSSLALRGQDHQAACLHRPHSALRQGACGEASGTFCTQTLAGGDAGVLGWEVNTVAGYGRCGSSTAGSGRPLPDSGGNRPSQAHPHRHLPFTRAPSHPHSPATAHSEPSPYMTFQHLCQRQCELS